MTYLHKILLLGTLYALTQGCATTTPMSVEQVISENKTIEKLATGLNSAKTNNVDLLAPAGYESARKYLDDAIAAVQAQNTGRANQLANEGLKQLANAQANAQSSQDILREVLEARQRAQKAGATTLFPNESKTLASDFNKTANLIETGKLEEAKQRRPKLIDAYANLELKALKEGTVQQAKAAIAQAKSNGADRYAPKTFKHAEDELSLALSILDVNRNQTEKADVHSNRAIELANRSASIAELVKDFDRRNYKPEDIVLWYQEELAKINEPLNQELDFTQDNRKTVLGLHDSIASLVTANAEYQQMVVAHKNEIETLKQQNMAEMSALEQKYEQQIAMLDTKQAEKARQEQEAQRRFEIVQSLFAENEADIYRQRENVLISAHGFYFPPGGSEIQTSNFGMLNKIIRSVNEFPNARLSITGHTDSTGDAKMNLALSEERAKNVAKFLHEVGNIPMDKISVKGFGKEKPVASNETKEGRALNRRIDVLIVNEEPVVQ